MEKRPPPTITNATIPSDPKGKNLRKIRDFYRGPYVFRNIISEREERIDRVPLLPLPPPFVSLLVAGIVASYALTIQSLNHNNSAA